jgi:MYXO-CTERM domain-containing protein
MAALSPLRFHYDAESFSLPVRLGLVNSSGTQDLVVHILARNQRYEVANYKNVTIPTNLDVDEQAREQFGAFYAALFDRTVEQSPGAVVTEYSWISTSCDPCPGPTLDPSEVAILGGDTLPSAGRGFNDFVLTRLHARYGKDALGDDLVFKAAGAIVGGREVRDASGKLESGARPDSYNNFQGRYAIRHPWKGAIDCMSPKRGIWAGPPAGEAGGLKVAQDLAFAPRGTLKLASVVQHDVPEIGLTSTAATVGHAGELPEAELKRGGSCGACRAGEGGALPATGALFASLAAALAWLYRRRDR